MERIFVQRNSFDNSYQTMPNTAWNYWNLIRFNEHEHPEHGMMLLMRKDQCMHCEDPGCLAACPADGAIVQYVNGIVDFQQEHCIGCGYCMTGCPFNIPKFSPGGAESFQVHALRGPGERGDSSLLASNRVRRAACISARRTT